MAAWLHQRGKGARGSGWMRNLVPFARKGPEGRAALFFAAQDRRSLRFCWSQF